jgi:hypothetical protein
MISFSLLNLIFLLEQNDFSKNDQIIGECGRIIGEFSRIIGECDRILIYCSFHIFNQILSNFTKKNLKSTKSITFDFFVHTNFQTLPHPPS